MSSQLKFHFVFRTVFHRWLQLFLFQPSHRVLAANPRLLWPQKTLYYEFSSGQFRGDLRTLVEDALQDIMEQSCVRFSPRGQQTTYLKLKETGKGWEEREVLLGIININHCFFYRVWDECTQIQPINVLVIIFEVLFKTFYHLRERIFHFIL